jgi:hypothetical protein
MIWYLVAKVEPVVSSSFGASIVFVGSEICSDFGEAPRTDWSEGSCVPHLLQNWLSVGFSELHLGHFMLFLPLRPSAKEYQFMRKNAR